MKRQIVPLQPDQRTVTRDTRVEITTSGDLEFVPDEPTRITGTLGEIFDRAMAGVKDAGLDPKKRPQLFSNLAMLTEVGDLLLGADSSTLDMAQPHSAEKVEGAAEALITNKAELSSLGPVAFARIDWPSFESDVGQLGQLGVERQRTGIRAENLRIKDAHVRQRLYLSISAFYEVASSIIRSHRGLSARLAPVVDLISGAALAAAETRKEGQRIKAKQEADKAGDKSAKSDDRAGADSADKAAAPASDKPGKK